MKSEIMRALDKGDFQEATKVCFFYFSIHFFIIDNYQANVMDFNKSSYFM